MENTVGTILDGKVKSIAKFGAFITFADGKTGLVHISEVANSFVNDINEHLTVGQDVKVKILAIDENGRINLSIKQVQEPAPRSRNSYPARSNNQNLRGEFGSAPARRPQNRYFPAANAPQPERSADQSFEEKLKAFMSESDSKIAGIKQYSDHRTKSRRR